MKPVIEALIGVLKDAKEDPYLIDADMFLAIEKLRGDLDRACEKFGVAVAEEHTKAFNTIKRIYEEKEGMATDRLIALLQKADKWLQLHPSDSVTQTERLTRVKALSLYVGMLHELKLRGIGEYEALKTIVNKVNSKMINEVFGELVIEIRGGDK